MNMDLTHYRDKLIGTEDERAVSPVIGVILMVAITVILAAVIAAFVLDIGDLDDSAPNAQFDWENVSEDEVHLTHTSGDDIDTDELRVSVTANGDTESTDLQSEDFTAGDTIEITLEEESVDLDGNIAEDEELNDLSGDPIEEVTITWSGDGSSTIIAEYEP